MDKKTAKKKKPKFNVMNLGFMKSVKDRWRKPRGIDNKKKAKYRFTGASPRIGYKNQVEIRGKHPTNLKEVLVNNLSQVEEARKGNEQIVLRIASAVGKKKRVFMIEKAHSLGIKVLNA